MKPYRWRGGWAVRYDLGPDPETGKRRQRMLTGRTRKEVEGKQAAALVEREAGGAVDKTKLTVGAYLDYWLEHAIDGRRAPTTAERYRRTVRLQIAPRLGATRLAALTAVQLSRLYSALKAGGLADGTIAGVHAVLHGALGQAVKWRFLAASVAEAVESPKKGRYQGAVWDTATARRFREALEADYYGPVFALAIVAGLRRGELLGLRWADVDLDAGALAVRQQHVRVGGKTLTTPPKGGRSRRLDLSPEQVAFLRWHRERQEEAARAPLARRPWNPGGHVFVTRWGGALSVSSYNRAWAQLLAETGVPVCRPHDLRHLNATLMLKAGVHPKVVQERLGHSTIGITLDTYSHVLPGLGREAADRLDDVLRPPELPPPPPALPPGEPLDGAAADE